MKLAGLFMDGMVLQCRKPILIWGSSEEEGKAEVKINGEKVCVADIAKGNFTFLVPGQEPAEDVTLEIGDITLCHVDIGEVWIAGGQSNMEFLLKYDQDGEAEIAAAQDAHLRVYIVGQYSFDGEREAGYKEWNPWDKWMDYRPEYAEDFPAAAVYFAKELRRRGIPVGIIGCNWGGTSASAWIDKNCLLADPELKTYVEDFDALVAKLDLDKYYAIKKIIRPVMASPATKKAMEFIMKTTFTPSELEKQMAAMQQTSQEGVPDVTDGVSESIEGLDLAKISIADLMAVGPGDPNEPGTLYEHMLKEIMGCSVRGVIWYQGETDDIKAKMYAKLFSAMIACWRRDWKSRNASMETLPFLFVQLAPFGIWRNATGKEYPLVRSQQETVAHTVLDVHMTSSSDIGNVFDIHPKNKKEVGRRLALLAGKYLYGEELLADAPEAETMIKEGDTLKISFRYGDGLFVKKMDFSSYNGFGAEDIDEELLPPVLDGINGLKVWAGEEEVAIAQCGVEEERLIVRSEHLRNVKSVKAELAQTAFYQVNLYNEAGIAAKPFVLNWEGEVIPS